MFEKVNPMHPDKICDRIGGAVLDLAYKTKENPIVAGEILLGHGKCHIIIETDIAFSKKAIEDIVHRIAGENIECDIVLVMQDEHLSKNQKNGIKCGDNGIFRGMPITEEQNELSVIARDIYSDYPFDGKYILDGGKLIICQSNAKTKDLELKYPGAIVNPIGDWTGGSNVDSGACNRKLGSDMGDAVTGGGLHFKDLSKADVSVNIYAHLMANDSGEPFEVSCAIGDEYVDGRKYSEIVIIARDYIRAQGGFEKFAEWGLI